MTMRPELKRLQLADVQCRDCDCKVGQVWFGGETRLVDPKPINTPYGRAVLLHVCRTKPREPGEDDDR